MIFCMVTESLLVCKYGQIAAAPGADSGGHDNAACSLKLSVNRNLRFIIADFIPAVHLYRSREVSLLPLSFAGKSMYNDSSEVQFFMTDQTTKEPILFSDIQVSFCSEEQWNPKQVFGPGSRLHYQLYAVLSGRGILQIGNELYYLQEGDTVFLTPGTRFYLEADEYTPWHLAWTAFSGEQSGEYLQQSVYRRSRIRSFLSSREQLAEYMLHLVQVFERENSRPMEITGALLQLLSFLLPPPRSSIRRSEIKQYHLGRAKNYLEENYCYDIRIQDISHQLGLDRSYVYRLFMELEDKSPTEYLFDIRMEHACSMLKDQRCSAAEAAYTCGFADPESLNYHFLQRLKMTPEDYKWTQLKK